MASTPRTTPSPQRQNVDAQISDLASKFSTDIITQLNKVLDSLGKTKVTSLSEAARVRSSEFGSNRAESERNFDMQMPEDLANNFNNILSKLSEIISNYRRTVVLTPEAQTNLNTSFGNRLGASLKSSVPLSSLGAFAQGDPGPLTSSIGMMVAKAIGSAPLQNLPGVGSALRTALPNMLGSVGSGLANNGLLGGASALLEAGGGVGGAVVGGAAALGGVAIGANVLQAQANSRTEELFANIGALNGAPGSVFNPTPTGVEKLSGMTLSSTGDQSILSDVLRSGSLYNWDPDTSIDVADTLGSLGMRAGNNIPGTNGQGPQWQGEMKGMMQNTAYLAQTAQIAPTTAAALVGTMAESTRTRGESGDEEVSNVATALQELNVNAKYTQIPLNNMINQLQTLAQITGGISLSKTGMQQFSGLAGYLGTQYNVGSLTSPLSTNTGFNAEATAGMLGMSNQAFMNMQNNGNVAQYFDTVSSRLKQMTTGQSGATRIDNMVGLAQGLGLINMSGLTGQQQNQLGQLMLSGGPNAAQQYTNLMAKAGAGQISTQQGMNQNDIGKYAQELAQSSTNVAKALAAQTKAFAGMASANIPSPAGGVGQNIPGISPMSITPSKGIKDETEKATKDVKEFLDPKTSPQDRFGAGADFGWQLLQGIFSTLPGFGDGASGPIGGGGKVTGTPNGQLPGYGPGSASNTSQATLNLPAGQITITATITAAMAPGSPGAAGHGGVASAGSAKRQPTGKSRNAVASAGRGRRVIP